MQKKHIVIGLGEVGAALKNILDADGYDTSKPSDAGLGPYEVMHVCIPWHENFKATVQRYDRLYHPDIIIVHSSVPVGTCDAMGWVHSPVRGVHPNLELGIRTFTKFFGGELAADAAAYFEALGIHTYVTMHARNTEAAKLWDTTQYGALILLEKEIYAYCKREMLDFGLVYTFFNETYNDGYIKLDMPHVVRPALKHVEGLIGGHCVIPNAKLLNSPTAGRIIRANSTGGE